MNIDLFITYADVESAKALDFFGFNFESFGAFLVVNVVLMVAASESGILSSHVVRC